MVVSLAMFLTAFIVSIFFFLTLNDLLVKVRRFRKAGVKFITPIVFFGNLFKSVFKIRHLAYLCADTYNAFPDDKYAVFFEMMKPHILIKDPQLIKKISTEKYSFFADRIGEVDEIQDPLLGEGIAFLKGSKWYKMRSSLASGFKTNHITKMCPIILKKTEDFIMIFNDIIESSDSKTNGIIELKLLPILKEHFTRVIGALTYGSIFDDRDFRDKNNEMLSKLEMNHFRYMLFLISKYFLGFLRMTGIPFFNSRIKKYFSVALISAMDKRSTEPFESYDFLTLFEEIKKDWNISHLTSQTVTFMMAAPDSLASMFLFLAYEITMNPNIQYKMKNEIMNALNKNNSQVDYEMLTNLQYVDMVLYETLRKWPLSLAALNRSCTKDFILEPPRTELTTGLQVLKGDGLLISQIGLHHDPKYWDAPEDFVPERFSKTNIDNIQPYTYLPFGVGPRSCLGKRLAMIAMKMLLVRFLTTFEFVKTNNTKEKIAYDIDGLTLKPNNIHLGVKYKNGFEK